MAINIREGADPLSDASLRSRSDSAVKNIQSDAGRVLRLELTRYCKGQVNGRSFLVAGHRGAGKTTTVADALDRVLRKSRKHEEGLLRPLPIFLHGPSLFESGPREASGRSKGKRDAPATDSIAEQAKVALQQIILGLHRAVAKEFVRAYRERLVRGATYAGLAASERMQRAELAAQFEIELFEDPSAARLREFWDAALALDGGVLFDEPRGPDQGARELVALNGMCNAHQRISGDTNAADKNIRSEDTVEESGWGLNAQTAELIKPLVSILAGAGVAGGAVAGSAPLGASLLAGILTAAAATAFFKSSSSGVRKTGRQVDTIFIPDLTLKTLDRILPTLLDRLREAGLAPVVVVDELDKVLGLPDRLVAMIHFLKKLVAENVFTCFLTDRAYMEHLRTQGRATAYGRAYSYFSHPLLITFQPSDIDRYLDDLLEIDVPPPTAGTPPAEAGGAPGGLHAETSAPPAASAASIAGLKSDPREVDKIDLELLKWVLRHRSQLHALALTREISSLRGEDGTVQIRPGAVRTELTYRIDVTFQVAIELQLRMPLVQGWLRQRPEMMQTLFDALYYVSRLWLAGVPHVDLGLEGRAQFADYLTGRMNLDELSVPGQQPAAMPARVVSSDDLAVLNTVVNGIVTFLSESNDSAKAKTAWERLAPDAAAAAALPLPSVMSALLLNGRSLLLSDPGKPKMRWRYWPSGIDRQPGETQAPDASIFDIADLEPAIMSIEKIGAIEKALWPAFKQPGDPDELHGQVFELLQDRARVLPTSPAWARVRDAMANLRSVWADRGGRALLADDVSAVTDFESLLRTHEDAVVRILAAARGYSGVRSDAASGAGTVQALLTLSDALGFAYTDTAGAASAVAAWQADVARIYDIDGPWLLPDQAGPFKLDDPGLPRLLDKALAEGRRVGKQLKWEKVTRDAWDATRRRLTAFAAGGSEPPPDGAEILCAIAAMGPARWIGTPLGNMRLHQWTSLFMRAALPTTGAVALHDEAPTWLAVFALRQLGASALAHDQIDLLLSWLEQSKGASAFDPVEAARILKQRGPLSTVAEGSARVAMCIAPGGYPAWNWWSIPPKQGLAFFFDKEQLEALPAGALKSLLAVLPKPMLVAVDTSYSDKKSAMKLVSGRFGDDNEILWVYSGRKKGMLEPNVIDPSGPDELLDHAPRAASGPAPPPAT